MTKNNPPDTKPQPDPKPNSDEKPTPFIETSGLPGARPIDRSLEENFSIRKTDRDYEKEDNSESHDKKRLDESDG